MRSSSFRAARLRDALLVALPLFVAGTAGAQVGSIDQNTNYAVVTGPTGPRESHGRLEAIVMWRGDLGWSSASREEQRRLIDAFEDLRDHDRGPGSYFGSTTAYAYLEGDSAVTVEGRRILLEHGDSALAILVTIPGNGLPRLVTVGRIPPLPERFYMKHWLSGDTSITVQPRWPEMQRMLVETVRQSAEGAAFLAGLELARP
jgi:hypothetical protein